MNPRKQAEAALKEKGFVLFRKGANHDLYLDPLTKEMIPLSRSIHFNDNDLKGTKREIEAIEQKRKTLTRNK